MTAGDLINEVSEHLVDTDNVRWSKDELLEFMNKGIQTFIIKKPTISLTTITVSLSDKNLNLPDDGYKLIGVNHVDGLGTPYIDMDKLNQLYPTWRKETGAPSLWTKIDDDDDHLILYPAPVKEVEVEYVYSANKTAETIDSPFPLKSIYKSIIFDYMIYRAYDKDSEDTSSAQTAQNHLMLFATGIGDKDAAERIRKQWLATKEISR